MKKIPAGKAVRANLKNERAYEKTHKTERNASKRIKTPIRQEARKKLEKKIGRKLKKGETVGHKKPIAKGGTNSNKNLKVQSAKANFAEGGKLRVELTKKKRKSTK